MADALWSVIASDFTRGLKSDEEWAGNPDVRLDPEEIAKVCPGRWSCALAEYPPIGVPLPREPASVRLDPRA